MANGNGITLQEAIEAAKGSKGFVTQIAARLACSRRHVYNLMDKWVTFREAVEDERETLKDFAEGALLKKINGGDTASIIFYLKCQAKERGYVERTETRSINIDVSKLSDDELERVANGEDPFIVIGAKS